MTNKPFSRVRVTASSRLYGHQLLYCLYGHQLNQLNLLMPGSMGINRAD